MDLGVTIGEGHFRVGRVFLISHVRSYRSKSVFVSNILELSVVIFTQKGLIHNEDAQLSFAFFQFPQSMPNVCSFAVKIL